MGEEKKLILMCIGGDDTEVKCKAALGWVCKEGFCFLKYESWWEAGAAKSDCRVFCILQAVGALMNHPALPKPCCSPAGPSGEGSAR